MNARNRAIRTNFLHRLVTACLVMGLLVGASTVTYRRSFAATPLSTAVVRAGGSTLYSQPNGAAVSALRAGAVVTATGRNADQTWIAIESQAGENGWIPSASLIGVDLGQLPIVPNDSMINEPAADNSAPAVAAVTPATAVPATTGRTVLGIAAAQGADLLDAPNGAVTGHIEPGQVLQATQRNADTTWVWAQGVNNPALQGWVATAQLYIVDADQLPEADATDAPVTATLETVETPPQLPSAPGDATVIGVATIQATVDSQGDRLNLRSGPDTAYPVIAKALDGESYRVLGRNEDGGWLQLDISTGHAAGYGEPTGWAAAAFLSVAGPIDALPLMPMPPAVQEPAEEETEPTANPTPQPAPDAGLQMVSAASPVAGFAPASGLAGTLVFQAGPGGQIYAYNLASSALTPLTHGFDPALSPDGQTVAFVRDGGENGVYLIDIGGGNERLIFSGRAQLSSPKWSPDGAWILFTRGDEFVDCYQMGPSCIEPGSLPEGFKVDSDNMTLTRQYDYKLARVDRDGNNYRDIPSLEYARAADWNAAGIVYQSKAGLQITADTPNSENRLVIFDYLKPFYDDPDWQPDGRRIAYMGKEASHWEIFTVNPDGSGKTALTRPATTLVDELPSSVAPAWSPDGQSIAFLSNRSDDGSAGAWRLWVMDADGGNQRPLSIPVEITYTFGGEQAVSWGQ